MWINYKKIFGFLLLLLLCNNIFAGVIRIVAAENFYGDLVNKIGGDYVQVTSIMHNPNQDPHLFSSNWSTAKAVAEADIIVYNGLEYDSWIKTLIRANRNQENKKIIVVADLIDKKAGANPHIWYDPNTMLVCAKKVTTQLSELDTTHEKYYQNQFSIWQNQSERLEKKIKNFKKHYQGVPVIATEPVFNYMAYALGLRVYGDGFQLSIMNNTEPSISDIKDFTNKLQQREVKVLIYNNQVTNPLTLHMQDLAKQVGISVLGVSELQPVGDDYFGWMNGQLNNLQKTLVIASS